MILRKSSNTNLKMGLLISPIIALIIYIRYTGYCLDDSKVKEIVKRREEEYERNINTGNSVVTVIYMGGTHQKVNKKIERREFIFNKEIKKDTNRQGG